MCPSEACLYRGGHARELTESREGRQNMCQPLSQESHNSIWSCARTRNSTGGSSQRQSPLCAQRRVCTRRTSSSAPLQLWHKRVSIEGTATPGIVSCVHRREGVKRKRIAQHQGPGARSWHADLGFARLCVLVSGILFKPGESDRAVLICLQLARRKPFDRLPRPLCRRFGLRPLNVRLGRHRGPGRCSVPRRLQNHNGWSCVSGSRPRVPSPTRRATWHGANCLLLRHKPRAQPGQLVLCLCRAKSNFNQGSLKLEANKLRDALAAPSCTAAGGSVAPTSQGPAAP